MYDYQIRKINYYKYSFLDLVGVMTVCRSYKTNKEDTNKNFTSPNQIELKYTLFDWGFFIFYGGNYG